MLSHEGEAGTRDKGLRLRLTLVSARGSRTFVLPPLALAILAGVLPLAGIFYFAATCYFVFHDDLLKHLMKHEIVAQYAYSEHLAHLRHTINNLKENAAANEAEMATRLGSLAEQQGELENRTILIAQLARQARALHAAAFAAASAGVPPAAQSAFAPVLPSGPRPYVPAGSLSSGAAGALPTAAKPQPDGFALRLSNSASHMFPDAAKPGVGRAGRHEQRHKPSPRRKPSPLSFAVPLTPQLDRLAARQGRLDHLQLALLAELRRPAQRLAARLRAAFKATGLKTAQLRLPAGARKTASREATGGPFVPLPAVSPGGAAFTRAAIEAEDAISTAKKLRLIATHVPLASPLDGSLFVTSPFGPRIDPFYHRPAFHTGLDLRADYGAPVKATAAGTVDFAGVDAGYGNLVEINHGNGLVTRYAHLSHIGVHVGEKVKTGTIIGRIGETGRATGPHLHYETRVDGEPVNPERFLRAGEQLQIAGAGADL